MCARHGINWSYAGPRWGVDHGETSCILLRAWQKEQQATIRVTFWKLRSVLISSDRMACRRSRLISEAPWLNGVAGD